jgi:hypothetical protein
MSLANWAKNGWLQSHRTSGQEIDNLLAIVERELTDAAVPQISLFLLRLELSSCCQSSPSEPGDRAWPSFDFIS